MSAFSPAALLLFPGLGLVALAIGLLVRRYSASAFAVGLSGLLTLATASTWITAAEGQKAELEDVRSRTGEAKTEPNQTADSELRAEQRKRAEAERRAADADRRAAVATSKTAELDGKVRKARDDKVLAEGKVALLEEKLRSAEPVMPPPKLPDLASVRRRLAEGRQAYYTTQEERELIAGRKGAWYVVRILQNGSDWSFADREFVLTDATDIKASATRLRDDILIPLSQAGHHWRLFVRGAADARRVISPSGRDVSYLPLLPDGTYASETTGKRVIVPVQNEDLPTLRADWLREIIAPVVGTGDIDILENPPQQEHRRTAELVLFVEW